MPFSIRPFYRFLYNALSRITLCHSKARAPLGISPVPAGDSTEICRCDRGDPLVDRHTPE